MNKNKIKTVLRILFNQNKNISQQKMLIKI